MECSYCPICMKFLPVIEGVVVHDDIDHPESFIPGNDDPETVQ